MCEKGPGTTCRYGGTKRSGSCVGCARTILGAIERAGCRGSFVLCWQDSTCWKYRSHLPYEKFSFCSFRDRFWNNENCSDCIDMPWTSHAKLTRLDSLAEVWRGRRQRGRDCSPVAPESVSDSSTSKARSSTLTSVCVAVGGNFSITVRKVSWKSTACHTLRRCCFSKGWAWGTTMDGSRFRPKA